MNLSKPRFPQQFQIRRALMAALTFLTKALSDVTIQLLSFLCR